MQREPAFPFAMTYCSMKRCIHYKDWRTFPLSHQMGEGRGEGSGASV